MKTVQFILVAVVGLLVLPGMVHADTSDRMVVFPPGSMQQAAPSASASDLIKEARGLSLDIKNLREEAMQDTSMKAFGSALERYEAVRNALVKQLALLEEAIDVADDTRVRIQAIREYDRVEKEVVAAKRFLAILDIQ